MIIKIDIMKKIYLCTLACQFIFAAVSAFAQEPENFQSFVEVNGYAEKEVAPDVFYMQININEEDTKGKKTLEQQQRSMVSALKALKIDTDKKLTRESLSSYFYNRKTNMQVATYQLKLNKAEDVAKVLSALDDLGISNVSFSKAEYSRIDELKDEVRKDAVRNAKQQAESMAEAIGQTVGKCFYIYCGYSGNAVLYAQPRMSKAVMNMDMAVEEAYEEESIEFDNIKVSMNVSTKFVLN